MSQREHFNPRRERTRHLTSSPATLLKHQVQRLRDEERRGTLLTGGYAGVNGETTKEETAERHVAGCDDS